MNPTTLVRKISQETNPTTIQRNTSKLIESLKNNERQTGINKSLSLSSYDSLSLSESDIETCQDSNVLSSAFTTNTPLNRDASFKNQLHFPIFNDDILPAIPETRAKVEDNRLIDKAQDFFQSTKSFLDIYKYQIKQDKSILPQLLMQKSIDRANKVVSTQNDNNEDYSFIDALNTEDLIEDLNANPSDNISSEVMFTEETFEQRFSFQDDFSQNSQNPISNHPTLRRSETLTSSELANYMKELKNSSFTQDENDDFLSCFK